MKLLSKYRKLKNRRLLKSTPYNFLKKYGFYFYRKFPHLNVTIKMLKKEGYWLLYDKKEKLSLIVPIPKRCWIKEPYTEYFEIKSHYRILEVGGCIGESTLLFAKKAAKVISIEPIPANYELLCKNVNLNCFKNVHCINKAVWSKKGNINIGIKKWMRRHSVFANCHKNYKARATTLNDLHSQYGPFHYIVMDIQGAEMEALKGGERALKKATLICVESHPHLRKKVNLNNFIISLLEKHNFSVKVVKNGKVSHIYGRK